MSVSIHEPSQYSTSTGFLPIPPGKHLSKCNSYVGFAIYSDNLPPASHTLLSGGHRADTGSTAGASPVPSLYEYSQADIVNDTVNLSDSDSDWESMLTSHSAGVDNSVAVYPLLAQSVEGGPAYPSRSLSSLSSTSVADLKDVRLGQTSSFQGPTTTTTTSTGSQAAVHPNPLRQHPVSPTLTGFHTSRAYINTSMKGGYSAPHLPVATHTPASEVIIIPDQKFDFDLPSTTTGGARGKPDLSSSLTAPPTSSSRTGTGGTSTSFHSRYSEARQAGRARFDAFKSMFTTREGHSRFRGRNHGASQADSNLVADTLDSARNGPHGSRVGQLPSGATSKTRNFSTNLYRQPSRRSLHDRTSATSNNSAADEGVTADLSSSISRGTTLSPVPEEVVVDYSSSTLGGDLGYGGDQHSLLYGRSPTPEEEEVLDDKWYQGTGLSAPDGDRLGDDWFGKNGVLTHNALSAISNLVHTRPEGASEWSGQGLSKMSGWEDDYGSDEWFSPGTDTIQPSLLDALSSRLDDPVNWHQGVAPYGSYISDEQINQTSRLGFKRRALREDLE